MNEIYKYRIKFTKVDKMRYIGHLDLLKYFQRAIKRARVPIAYSTGFNPHQLMSFATPLPLGMSSTSEFVDIRLETPMECEELKNALNAQMSLGMELTEVRRMAEGEDTGAALLRAADHIITLDRKLENADEMLKSLENDAEWLIEKVGKKKKVREVDIRPMVYELRAENAESGENTKLFARIATGSDQNLKVDLMLEYMYKKWGFEFDYLKIKVTRTGLYKKEESGEFTLL